MNNAKIAIVFLLTIISLIIIIKYNILNNNTISVEENNMYTIKFNENWSDIKNNLNIQDARFDNIHALYKNDGTIIDLKFSFYAMHNDKISYYQTVLQPPEYKLYSIRKSKTNVNISDYNSLIDMDEFITALMIVADKELPPFPDNYSHSGIWARGVATNYHVSNTETYIIKNDNISEIKNLPIKGYYISSYGMYKTNNRDFPITAKDYFYKIHD